MPMLLARKDLKKAFDHVDRNKALEALKTRSGKGAHGMDLKDMGAAHTGDEAGATLLRMIQDNKRIAQAAIGKPSGVHFAGGDNPNETKQEVGKERKRLRLSA